MSRDDSQVGGDPVAALHLHQVADHHLLGVDALLLAVADDQGLLRDERHFHETKGEKVGHGVCSLAQTAGASDIRRRDLKDEEGRGTCGTRFLKESMILELLAS